MEYPRENCIAPAIVRTHSMEYPRENCIAPAIVLIVWSTPGRTA